MFLQDVKLLPNVFSLSFFYVFIIYAVHFGQPNRKTILTFKKTEVQKWRKHTLVWL